MITMSKHPAPGQSPQPRRAARHSNGIRPLATIVILALAAGALSGCNTISGVGKDVEKAGQALDKAAR